MVFIGRGFDSGLGYFRFSHAFVFCLELRENLSRLGTNLKQKFVESVRETWASINDFARAHTGVFSPDEPDKGEVQKDVSDSESQSMYCCVNCMCGFQITYIPR